MVEFISIYILVGNVSALFSTGGFAYACCGGVVQ